MISNHSNSSSGPSDGSHGARLTAAAMLALLCACGGSGNGPAPIKVTDQQGRHCSVPFDAIDPPTCDVAPMPSTACAGGATACFQVGTLDVAAQYKPAAICSACCGTQGLIHEEDCSGIVCKADADCPSDYPTCSNGQCFIQH